MTIPSPGPDGIGRICGLHRRRHASRASRAPSLPLVRTVPAHQATVPSNWLKFTEPSGRAQVRDLEVRAGKTLQS